MKNFNDISVIIDQCSKLFDGISNVAILKNELVDYKNMYKDVCKSRSAYFDAFSYLLIKLLGLSNKFEVIPIIRKIVLDNSFVNYDLLDEILEGYNGKID